jgi:hypothetical protein
VENENKAILIATLKLLLKDLQREKFVLNSIKKKKNQLSQEEQVSTQKINEIRNRITYNVNKHKELLKEN